MNEPYNRVHKQENSNSTLYTNIGTDIGIGLGTAAAIDGYGVYSKKTAKTPMQIQHVKDNYYTDYNVKQIADQLGTKFFEKEGKVRNAIGKLPIYGPSTTKGRIFNYGTAIGAGLLTGALRTNKEDE